MDKGNREWGVESGEQEAMSGEQRAESDEERVVTELVEVTEGQRAMRNGSEVVGACGAIFRRRSHAEASNLWFAGAVDAELLFGVLAFYFLDRG